MTSFNGLLYNSYELGGEAANGQSSANPELANMYLAGSIIPGLSVAIPTNHSGKSIQGTPTEVIYEEIYFTPSSINAGFIADSSNHNVYIWNAYLTEQKTITQVQIINLLGTQSDIPTPPFVIPKNSEKNYTITILKDGPAIQSTQYLLTIGSELFIISITGKRILAFNFVCVFKDMPKIKYAFETIIFSSEYFREQRRPLLQIPIRSISANFIYNLQEAERFINEVRNLSKKVLGIPIWSEPIHPTTSNLQGVTVIAVSENLDEYFNLNNNVGLILIRSRTDQYKYELKAVVDISTNSITLDIAVVASFTAADTIIYPVVIGVIESKNFTEETAKIITASIEFKEIKPDGG